MINPVFLLFDQGSDGVLLVVVVVVVGDHVTC